MARKSTVTGPVVDAAPGLRQRLRSDGTWRIWWEPTPAMRKAGAKVVEFAADAPGHAVRQARGLHEKWCALLAPAAGAQPVAKKRMPTARTITDLIADYRAALDFTRKPASTRRVYDADLRAIAGKWGPQPVALFDKPTLARWYETLHAARGVTRSRAILRMMSVLMSHAELRGWRPENSNPCRGLRTETPLERERTASWAEINALLAAARRLRTRAVLTALYLVLLGGQRQYDILRARPGDFYPLQLPGENRPIWVWQLVQSKRKRAIEVAIHTIAVPTLRTQLMRAPDGPGTLIWDEATGKPFTPDSFFRAWEKVRLAAVAAAPSIATLQWRDLRRTFSNLSRAGGSSDADTGDALGNTAAKNPKLRRTYMAPQLATTLRAVTAIVTPKQRKA